jgi:hemerythrin
MLTLDYLKTWHRTFALHLELAVEGFESLSCSADDVGDETLCALGKWISAEKHKLADFPSFARLTSTHKEFHAAAKSIVVSHQSGDMNSVRGIDTEHLREASSAVHSAIELLEQDLLNTELLSSASPYRPVSSTPTSLWDDSLKIGVPVIDAQHRELAHLADRVLQQSHISLSSESGVDFLTNMTRLLSLHFDTEELLMRRISFPEAEREAHFAMHTHILEQITSLSFDMTQGTKSANISDVALLLRAILIDHVVTFDRSLIPYLNEDVASRI